jgi:DNA-binding response OmpR family regulator
MKVLIIEDNEILSKNISRYLKLEKIDSHQSFNWKDGLYEWLIQDYDCIILDLNLWDIDWLEVCQTLREKWKLTPILILSARNTLQDKLKWLNIWWDDYLTKPFEYEELVARIYSLVRRDDSRKSNIINIWKIKIDTNNKRIFNNKKEIKLTSLEYNLAEFLAKHQGQVISKEKLLEKVWWNLDSYELSRTVDVYISYLRKKIDKDFIKTRKGLWYIIE